MSLVVNIYYTGENGNARKFAEEMVSSGVVDQIRAEVDLKLDKTSTLTLTGDTYLKSLTNADTANSNINLNGYKLYIDGVEL